MDGKISQFLKMQHDLAVEKGWIDSRTPEHAPFSILWSIDELGEAIAIIKKKGADGIMNNESVREHFVEEIADTFMYLFDMMESYGITADEFTNAYVKKYEHNMGRTWHENDAMYEKSPYKLVIFDFTGDLDVPPRLLEVLSKTELTLAALGGDNLRDRFERQGLDESMFGYLHVCEPTAPLYEMTAETLGIPHEAVVVCTAHEDGLREAERLGMRRYAVNETSTLDGLQDFLGFPQ